MPDVGGFADRFWRAVADIEEGWRGIGAPAARLGMKELSAYSTTFAAGWRITVPFDDEDRRFDVLVARTFPYAPPRIALVDRPDFLTWPHIEKDGLLCLWPDHATHSIDDPYGTVMNLMSKAVGLLRELVAGGGDKDLRSEFLSYWARTTSRREPIVLSLVTPRGPSRRVRVWRQGGRVVFADDEVTLRNWVQNSYPQIRSDEMKFDNAAFGWFEEAPLPSEYPKTAADVRLFAEAAGVSDVLDEMSKEIPDRLFLLFGAATSNGPAMAVVAVDRPKVARSGDPLTRGFRANKMLEPILRMRFFGASPALKWSVERVDSEWIHGRGRDPRFAKLKGSTVLFLGCGSVGAPVVMSLAHAGIGRMILVDKKNMKAANIGRHPLGVSQIGKYKACALARRLGAELPHIKIDSRVLSAEELILRQDLALEEVDLIVSAMGDRTAEAMLDEWHTATGRRIPIVYGWTEAHAAAGHAVAVVKEGARLLDGFDQTGTPKLVATRWKEDQRHYEPACGAAFEPYGPVELGYVTAMLSETALDCLLQPPAHSEHRIWLGRRLVLELAGGDWTQDIERIAGPKPEGGLTLRRPWALDTATAKGVIAV